MSLAPPKLLGLKSEYITGNIAGKTFRFCINTAKKNFSISEKINQRWLILYYYVVCGNGMGYDTNNPLIKLSWVPKKICDARLSNTWSSVSFECSEDVEIIGFNATDKNDVWKAELVDKNQTYIKSVYYSVIFCFNGNMKVNDKPFNKYNFACLDKNVEYKLELNDTSEIGLFKLIQ